MGSNRNRNQSNQTDKQKPKEYISPLKDELNFDLEKIGQGVHVYHDEKNERLLVDIDIGTRRNITISGKSIKIATATHMIKGLMKLTLNVFDAEMNDDELDELEIFFKNKAKRESIKKKQEALQ